MSDDIDDDIEWERWMGLTDAERAAEEEQAWREYEEWWNSLTPRQQWEHRRRSYVGFCLTARKLMRAFPGMTLWHERLKDHQIQLVKIRTERKYGHIGSA